MKQQALSNFELTWLPLTGLVIFCLCFGVYFWWTMRKANKPVYENASQIPLDEARKIQ